MSKEKNSSQITFNEKSPSNNSRLLTFVYNSNNRLLKKDFVEKENNSEKLSLASLKKEILFNRDDRKQGVSSFNFFKLLNLAIEGITSFTTSPLRVSTILGIIISFIAFLYLCFILAKTIIYGDPVRGFPALMSVILFLGGVQLLSLGVIGEYLGRIFYETKNRPVYMIEEKEGV